MKKIVLVLMLLFGFANAEVMNFPISKNVVNSGKKIIDIRTKAEWKQTGVIKNSILITFFDEMGRYNLPKFLKALNAHIKKNERFALVCRTGHRSRIVAKYLGEHGYHVIDLLGGVQALARDNYKFVKYENNK
ncbi:MAG: rhodanese-like domain-containing protein [Sulfurospirillum sp.]